MQPINEEEEELWGCDQCGYHFPLTLINTLWLLFTLHFGSRGRQEHHTMRLDDFSLRTDDKGNEYLTFAANITKTRQRD